MMMIIIIITTIIITMTIVIIINPVRIRKTKHPNHNQLNTGYFVLLQQTFSQVT